jgi:predicted dehydrogenase
MVKVGIFGVGHLGRIHLAQLADLKHVELIGFYDPHDETARSVEAQYRIKRYEDPALLIQDSDMCDVVTPTVTHFDLATQILRAGKHIFIEKPVTESSKQAEELCALVREAGVKCSIGHVERFNPAFLSVKKMIHKPMFIESHRLSQFNPRGTDVSVVFDLMIHDLDIILNIVQSDIKRISASGVSVLSEQPDIANVRLEFNNGCVANITSSRLSLNKMRKMRIFQQQAYLSIDFLNKKSELIKIKSTIEQDSILDIPITLADGSRKVLTLDAPVVEESNAIKEELRAFIDCILHDTDPPVSIEEAYHAVTIAERIVSDINNLIIK